MSLSTFCYRQMGSHSNMISLFNKIFTYNGKETYVYGKKYPLFRYDKTCAVITRLLKIYKFFIFVLSRGALEMIMQMTISDIYLC